MADNTITMVINFPASMDFRSRLTCSLYRLDIFECLLGHQVGDIDPDGRYLLVTFVRQFQV